MLPRDPAHREHAISRRGFAREAWKETAGMPPEQRKEAYEQQIQEWDRNNPNNPAIRKGQQEQDNRGVSYKGTRWL
jgi:hypothetical protein